MTTTLNDVTAAGDTPSDAPSPLAITRTVIADLQARRAELLAKRDDAVHSVEATRTARAQMLAAGSGDTATLSHSIASLTDDVDGYTRAVAIVEHSLANETSLLRELELAEARARRLAVGQQRGAALDDLEARVRAIAGELRPIVASIRALENESRDRYVAVDQALRNAGKPSEGPVPHDPTWSAYPDLYDVVELLEKYASGKTRLQLARTDADTSRAMYQRIYQSDTTKDPAPATTTATPNHSGANG